MDDKMLDRAKEIISTLKTDDRNDSVVEELLQFPARYLLVGEHPRYGGQYVWGFRHTKQEAVAMSFQRPEGFGYGDLNVSLAAIYDLQSKNYMKPLQPGPVDHIVNIAGLTISRRDGIIGETFVVGDAVMVRSSGVSPVYFWPGTIVSTEGRDEDGNKTYKVEYDPWGEGVKPYDVDALHVFRVDPKRSLPYCQHGG